ncbi:MAG: M23 family metallopeptidase [Desulfobulbaceae bacterium]|nr:M23 family metallopeptidase [Desulfobulbaceae bacterium]
MKFIKNIRFSLLIISTIFIGSVLIGNIKDHSDSQQPLLQTLLEKTDTLIHGGSGGLTQQEGGNFVSDDSYTVTEDTEIKEPSVPEIAGTIKRGETFDSSLKRQNVPVQLRLTIIDALRNKLDFKRIKPADNYTLQMDGNGQLASFSYESGPLDILTIKNSDEGYKVSKTPIELERKKVKISGEISSSLFAAFNDKNEDMRLVYAFADIFSSRIDFNTEIQPGDRYCLVVDKFFKNHKLVGYGKIEVAQYYRSNGTTLEAYLSESAKGKDVYFDQDGAAVGASFLRSPVPVGKMTSKFTYQRKHPISGKIKPHLGIDLAAPSGTPIMAVADGRVVEIGNNGGFGKQIVIAHSGDYKTHYGHLSRFKSGLRRGSVVSKKDIIGYVGSTGISTGPHLDYRIQHHMVFKDPFAMTFKVQIALTGKELKKFKEQRQALAQMADLDSFTPHTQTIKVSSLTITNKEHDISLLL